MGYRMVKLVNDTHTETGNDNTRRQKLASDELKWDESDYTAV